METRIIRIVALLLLWTVHVEGNTFEADKVKPFAQPEPVTTSDKAAVKFKPQLKISRACHPYPAVSSNDYTSAGMESSSSWTMSGCEGSDLGSQVYARSTWHNDVWAIMYAWYFPKGSNDGWDYTHDWKFVIVWIDNPAPESPAILGASMSTNKGLMKYIPLEEKYVDRTSVKVLYKFGFWSASTDLKLTEDTGGYQDLITWEQLPEVSRAALNNSYADTMPLKDGVFESFLDEGWN